MKKLLKKIIGYAALLFIFLLQKSLSAIRPGMREQEVIALLGTPQSVSKTAPNHAQLVYSCAGRWCGVTVHLDGEGRVQSVFHDH